MSRNKLENFLTTGIFDGKEQKEDQQVNIWLACVDDIFEYTFDPWLS